MADKMVVKDGYLSVAGTDWSDFCTGVTIDGNGNPVDINTFSSTATGREGGLPSFETNIEMVQGALDEVNAVYWGQWGVKVACVFRYSSADMGVNNAEYRWTGVLSALSAGGSVGSVAAYTWGLTPDGEVTRHTS